MSTAKSYIYSLNKAGVKTIKTSAVIRSQYGCQPACYCRGRILGAVVLLNASSSLDSLRRVVVAAFILQFFIVMGRALTASKILIVLLLVVLLAAPEAANARTCHDIFASAPPKWNLSLALDLIREVDPTHSTEYIHTLDFFTRMSLGPLVNKVRPEVLRRVGNYEEAAAVIDAVIKRDKFLRQIFSVRFHFTRGDKAVEWMTRAIVAKGLAGLVESHPSKFHRIQFHDRVTIVVKRIVRAPVIRDLLRLSSLQYRLPKLNDAPLPEDLLVKILVDGYPKHEKSLREYHLDRQMPIEAYRKASLVYRVVAMAISLAFLPHLIEKAEKQYEEFKSAQALRALEKEADTINAGLDELEAELNRRSGQYQSSEN